MRRQAGRDFEIAVLGGGLAGWSLVRALQRKGVPARELILLEARSFGAGTSGVPWALLHPFPGRSLYPRQDYLDAWRFSLHWLQDLQASAPGLELFRQLPLWRLALDAPTAGRFAKSYARARELDAYPLKQAAPPRLWPQAQGLYVLEQGRVVNLPLLVQLLRQQTGILAQAYSGQAEIAPADGGWRVSSRQGEFWARQLVLACGSGLRGYFPRLPFELSYGEVASFRLPHDSGPRVAVNAAVSAAGHFVAPLGDGLYHGGATHYSAERPSASAEAWCRLRQGLAWLPGMEQARPVRIWNGLRCGLRHDREPLVGPIPNQPGLWAMSAFSTRGLLLIPWAAQALANALLQGQAIPNWLGTGERWMHWLAVAET